MTRTPSKNDVSVTSCLVNFTKTACMFDPSISWICSKLQSKASKLRISNSLKLHMLSQFFQNVVLTPTLKRNDSLEKTVSNPFLWNAQVNGMFIGDLHVIRKSTCQIWYNSFNIWPSNVSNKCYVPHFPLHFALSNNQLLTTSMSWESLSLMNTCSLSVLLTTGLTSLL